MSRNIPLAIIYDFDGTLAPGNMQERDFIPKIGMNSKKFWNRVNQESINHDADNILIYMKLMLDEAKSSSVPVRRVDFENYGKSLNFFDGVLEKKINGTIEKGWFDRINEYGYNGGVKIEHYIVSSGIREMIEGTKIAKKFKKIYASSFCYDYHGIAVWPALAINYTTKTQFLFRINKRCLDISENNNINKYIPENERPIPFKNMIYIGDGETDIPCFRLIKDRGGHAIAVYKPNTKGARKKSLEFINNQRVNFITQADYKNTSLLDKIVKAIIDKVSHDHYVYSLK